MYHRKGAKEHGLFLVKKCNIQDLPNGVISIYVFKDLCALCAFAVKKDV